MRKQGMKLLITAAISFLAVLFIMPLMTEQAEAVTHDDLKYVPVTSITSYDGIINVQWDEIGNPSGTIITCQYYKQGGPDPNQQCYVAVNPAEGMIGYDQNVQSIDITKNIQPGDIVFVRLVVECPVDGGTIGKKYSWSDTANIAAIAVSSAKRPLGGNCVSYLDNYSYQYGGQPVEPTVNVWDRYKRLEFNKDYVLRYDNNNAPGQGYVYIEGCGHYQGRTALNFEISPGMQPMVVKATKKKVSYKKVKKSAQKVNVLSVSNARGALSYKKVSGSSKLKVNPNTGKVTVKKKTKKGTYRAKVKVTASGDGYYYGGSKTVKITVVVKK